MASSSFRHWVGSNHLPSSLPLLDWSMGLDYFSSRRDGVSEALWQGPDPLLHNIKGEMQVFAHCLNNSVAWKLPGHRNILFKTIYDYESPKGNLMHNHIFIWLQLYKRPINISADHLGNWLPPFQGGPGSFCSQNSFLNLMFNCQQEHI